MADERVQLGATDPGNIQKHLARYLKALPFVRDQFVLDASCGTGYGSLMLSLEAKRVIGWDIDEETIEFARSHYGRKNISFEVNDINNSRPISHVGLPDGQLFDVIVSFETLEHLTDPYATLKFFDSILKPGGVMLASVPLNEEMGWNEHHKHVFTFETAADLFSSQQPELWKSGTFLQKETIILPYEQWKPGTDTEPFTYMIAVLSKKT